MPIHDWTRVSDGTFHAFHHSWIEELYRALNRGVLPEGYYALPEQRSMRRVPDVLTLEVHPAAIDAPQTLARPKLQPAARVDRTVHRLNRLAVREDETDRLVAVIEVISRGNKSSREARNSFVRKSARYLNAGVHLTILDLHPPGKHDPAGMHNAVWRYVAGEPDLPADRPLTFASFDVGEADLTPYVVTAAVGDPLPAMPLFLVTELCVELPLEATYTAAFEALPPRKREPLERPAG